MTNNVADPHSLLYPKPGWGEHTGPLAFRVVLSGDEVRVAEGLYSAFPEKGAYVRVVAGLLEREGVNSGRA